MHLSLSLVRYLSANKANNGMTLQARRITYECILAQFTIY